MLQIVFNMERVRAISVMHDAHLTGKGSCGEFVRDIAETRVAEAEEYALLYEHPLRCRMEAA